MSGGFTSNTTESWLEKDVGIPPQYLPLYQQYLAQKNLPGNQNLDPATFIASAAAAGHVDTRTWAALGLGQSNTGPASTNNTFNQSETAASTSHNDTRRTPVTNLQLDGSSCHEVFFLLPVRVESINTDAHLQPSHTGARISMALWEKVKTPLLPCKDDTTAQVIQSAFPIRVRGTTKLNVQIEGITLVIDNAMVFEGQTPVESLVLGIDIMHSAGIIWDIAMSQISALAGRVPPRQLASFERLVSVQPTRDMLSGQAAYSGTWNNAAQTSVIPPDNVWSRDGHPKQHALYQPGSSTHRDRSPVSRRRARSPSVGSWSNVSAASSPQRHLGGGRRDRNPVYSRRDRSPISSRRDRSPRRDHSPIATSRHESSFSWRDSSPLSHSKSPGRDYRYSQREAAPGYSPPWPRHQSRSPSRQRSPSSTRHSYQRDSGRTSLRRSRNFSRSTSPRKTDFDTRYSSSSRRRSPSPARKRRRSPSPARKSRSSPSHKPSCIHKRRSRSPDRKGSGNRSNEKLKTSYNSSSRDYSRNSDSKDKSSGTNQKNDDQAQANESLKDNNNADPKSSTELSQLDLSGKTDSKSVSVLRSTESSDCKLVKTKQIALKLVANPKTSNDSSDNSVPANIRPGNAGPAKVTKVMVVRKVISKKNPNGQPTTIQKRVITVPKGTAKNIPGGVKTKLVKKIITRVKKPALDKKEMPQVKEKDASSAEDTLKTDGTDNNNKDLSSTYVFEVSEDEQPAIEAVETSHDLELEDISASEGEEDHMEAELEDVSSASDNDMMDTSSHKVLDDVSDTELPMSDDELRKHSYSKIESGEDEICGKEDEEQVKDEDKSIAEEPLLEVQMSANYIKEETLPDDSKESLSCASEPTQECVSSNAPDPMGTASGDGDKAEESGRAKMAVKEEESYIVQECVNDVELGDSVDDHFDVSVSVKNVECNVQGDNKLSSFVGPGDDQQSSDVGPGDDQQSSDVGPGDDQQPSDVGPGDYQLLSDVGPGDYQLISDVGPGDDQLLSDVFDDQLLSDVGPCDDQLLLDVGPGNDVLLSDVGPGDYQSSFVIPETDNATSVEKEDTEPKTFTRSTLQRKARKSFPKASPLVGKPIETITHNKRPQRARRGMKK